ncbi:MAG: hypothetical protein GY855_13570 [candidate division Zixibacteria bacterium]|nr:hypothetical protein [candidate division Zixibacteria bacterium]
MAIIAPLAAMIIQLAFFRSREYAAGEGGARFSHKPYALAYALSEKKICRFAKYSSTC